MNRRNYLRSILALGGLTITSLPIVSWLSNGRPIKERDLWEKKAIIAELAEMIIPASDTPGAKAASVDSYIISILLNCNNGRQQHRFLTGLDDIEQYTKDTFGRDFLQCNVTDKFNILQRFSENEAYSYNILNKVERKFLGQPFFSKLRELTVEGYCRSMLGATQGLAYDYNPGSYVPCTVLQIHQKSWATK